MRDERRTCSRRKIALSFVSNPFYWNSPTLANASIGADLTLPSSVWGPHFMVSRRLSFPFRAHGSRNLMEAAIWTSVVLGVALGLANAAASFLLYRVARNKSHGTFMAIVLGGMVARMFAVLALLALVIVFLPVSRVAFIGAFFATFAVAMTAEIILLQRRASPPVPSSSTESPPRSNGG